MADVPKESPAGLIASTSASNGNQPTGEVPQRPARRARRKHSFKPTSDDKPLLMVTKPLPRVLMLHTGGTLGMDPAASYEAANTKGSVSLRRGTGGVYAGVCQSL